MALKLVYATLIAVIIVSQWATPAHTKDLKRQQQEQQHEHQQRKHKQHARNLSPEQLLNEHGGDLASVEEFESAVFSWTGAKIETKTEPPPMVQAQRRKTKSGLLIERNLNLNLPHVKTTTTTTTTTKTVADLMEDIDDAEAAAVIIPKAATKTKQRNNPQRKRKVGRNQNRQKLQRNALRQIDHSSAANRIDSSDGLFPPPFNIAARAAISVNATCGQHGREEYCKLVDAYPHKKWATQCGICDAHASDTAKQRSIEAVVGMSATIATPPMPHTMHSHQMWWQSPTLQYGRHFEYVTITMDLRQTYQIFLVMLKSANSPRPASWILEKSLDGYSYTPWQYFGLSDADCRRRYDLPGQTGKYTFRNATEVICTTQFSKPVPLENGEVHVSLLKNRPGAQEQSAELLEFITARYIRIRLQGMHSTANLDNSVDWLLDAHSLEKRSFYSLKQIRVSGRLDCHGHADRTVELAPKLSPDLVDDDESTLRCLCQHNTCGPQCDQCCPLFRDKPYRNGTATDAHPCEPCQCNGHAHDCVYDAYLERGVCQQCANNTAGTECEFCVAGYYRAAESPLNEACIPCDCGGRGSTGHCQATGGACVCAIGFQGSRCDECAPGFYGADCRRCECDARGTRPDTECAGTCQCKANVEGDTCAECQNGYYDLSADHADGCVECWCSGVGLSCASAALQTLAFETLHDWRVTDLGRSRIALPTTVDDSKSIVYGMYDMGETEAIYWSAPAGYLRNRLTSYGSLLSVHTSWVTMRGDTSGHPTSGPSVVLVATSGMRIAYGNDQYADDTSSAQLNVTLDERGWYHVGGGVETVSRSQFLTVLSSIEALLIRASYHKDQVETALERVILYSGGSQLGGKPTTRVEQCVCPAGYTGLSCEGCDFGYIRVHENATVPRDAIGKCIPCPCNGHSNSCNLHSGECGDCMHNTYGERCERCKVGFYGNPLQGTAHDCMKCACPLLDDRNNFSPSCQLKNYNILAAATPGGEVALEFGQYICTQCPEGYIGDHCETCDDGWWGNPTVIGSKCLPCDCNGGPCDIHTGECITCSGNTEGWHCERCKLSYWGDAAVGCEPCDCYVDGADSDVCDSTNGECLCKPRFAGQKCDECRSGYANIDLKCLPCDCDENGTAADADDTCNPQTGQCQCKPNVVGLKCDQCAEGHFGLKEESPGCEECNCSPVGSVSNNCDKRSGQCTCLENVTGRRCDKCKAGHWNLTEGVGCHDCRCDPAGSRSHECNPWTGQCDCRIGVGGQRCNECTEGFYHFSADGCQRCAPCPGEGQVCDPLNGRCICPPNTRGLGCAQCVAGFWGWQPRLGCRECSCDLVGSIGNICETSTGQCQCREGYAGRDCNTCAVGYFGYPECRRCNCDVDGSFVRSDGLIACDDNGQCPCKSLVVGLKCDTCMQSTFGISALNPEGCTRCYCFGRSAECEQSEWSWGHIRMAESRNLSVQYLRAEHVTNSEYEYIVVIQMAGTQSYREDVEISVMNNLNLIPRSTGNVSIGAYGNFYHPMYFQLPEQFYRDRTSSYGGYLYFTLITEGAHTPLERRVLGHYPLVQIHAHRQLVLDFYEYEENEYSLNVTYKIPLHESYWKHHHDHSQTVDRATLMAALQNVKHIFLRGSAFADFTQVILQNVHMDSAVYVYGSTNMIAKGVERCKCPKRFDGLSCQDPGRGFYRWRNVTEVQSVFIEDLIGRAAPCQCNGRSGECDRETGVCLNCKDNTGGDHCDQCAEGFYGEPNSPYGCQSCPCPETSRNFAKGCTIWQGEVSCICKMGYTGKLCDRCRAGYFGNPLAYPNSTCQPCDCNLNGVSGEGCDAVTGQCYCQEGVTGLKCDECLAQRQVVDTGGCRMCDKCTLTLLDYVELIDSEFRRGIRHMDLTGIPAPHNKVEEYEVTLLDLSTRYGDYDRARLQLINYDTNALLKMDANAENTKFLSRPALATATKRKNAMGILRSDAAEFHTDLTVLRGDIMMSIYDLNNYGMGDEHMSLPMALEQARYYLDEIRQHRESVDQIRSASNCAWHHLYQFGNASDAAYDAEAKVVMLWRELNQTNFRMADMRLHADRTLDMQNEIQDVLEHVSNLKSHLIEDNGKIHELHEAVHGYLNQNLLPQTEVLLDENLGNQEQLAGEIKTIVRLSALLNASVTENEEVHRQVRKHWLPKAEKYAQQLMERSNEYARQFQPTRNGARIALMASSAHKNISDAIEAARKASLAAKERVWAAQQTLYPRDGGSVIDRARLSLAKSQILQKNALKEMDKANALKQKLQLHENKVEKIKATIYDAGTGTNNISGITQSARNTATRKLALESLELAKRTSEEMRAEARKAKQIQEGIRQLQQKFSILEPEWEIKLGRAEENISLTRTNVRLANVTLSYVEDQTRKEQEQFGEWNNTMARQLQELKDKIAKAKHAAESIKVSLESPSGPKCIRSYLPTSYGLSTSNSIKFSFALANRNANSPLLYLQGSEGCFISLELYKRHVRVVWNLGGSAAMITHPLEVQTRDPEYDDAWYHVEVNRTLNLATLLVRRMNNYGSLIPATPVNGYTDVEHTRFYQTPHERIYLGGYPTDGGRNRELQLQPGLNVVVHNVEVDNRPVGVWNFASTEGQCGGAMIGAQESTASSVARHFNGLGYAEVRKLRARPHRKNLFALQMTFKTLDENALLFLAVDNKNNRSVSVTLSRGRILFRIDYGDESKLEINTTEKYNTGSWVKIEAAREFSPKRGTENGMLRVDNARPITGSPTVPIKSNMLPDLSKPVYYLGGVPPGFTSGTTKAPGADNPFLGCMMDVQVNGETYDPLESSSYFGVEPSCKEMTTKAGFTGNGYLELPSQSLRKRANTGFVFRTLQPDCLLLLSAYPPEVYDDYDAKDIMGNYSFSLIGGHLQVWLNSGRSVVRLASNNTLNDGEFHVVNLIKNGRKFELMVDDELQEVKNLLGSPTVISMPRDAGGLYIGGAPSHEEYTPLAPTFIKLRGSMRDVVFNNRTLNFNNALSFAHVQIGRSGPAMGNANGLLDVLLKTEPMIGKSFTAAPEGCQRVGSYSYEPNAFKFGDDRISFAQLQLPQRSFWQRNFQISFSFRSFYPNGLIFLSPGGKDKQKHYVALLLKDGHLLLIVRGRRREELQLTAKLNNGEWHQVSIGCHDRKVTMSVEIGQTDQKTSAQMKVPKKIAASSVLFVGGLAEVPPKMPAELLARIEAFKGCLRRFTINSQTQDLARPGRHLNVGQCFPKVERGSYFPGDAYAVYKKNFQVGKYLELEMEFRTSELSGILLSISEPNGFPALSLEIHNGNVIFSCDLGDGNPFRVQSLVPTKYALCNNGWHNISALYDYEQIALRVDHLPSTMAVAQQRNVAGKVQTKSPLYIGGIPDIAPTGSLLSRENFKGCIRNVSIRNERRDWIDMDSLHNVLLSECYISGSNN